MIADRVSVRKSRIRSYRRPWVVRRGRRVLGAFGTWEAAIARAFTEVTG